MDFEVFVVATSAETAAKVPSGDWIYNRDEAQERLYDFADYALYTLKVSVDDAVEVIMSFDNFNKAVKSDVAEDVDVWDAYESYISHQQTFDEWWTKVGKSRFTVDTSGAVAALRALTGD